MPSTECLDPQEYQGAVVAPIERLFRCNHCDGCRSFRRWLCYSRLLPAMGECDMVVEWTLTYAPQYATADRSRSVCDVQRLFKRLRRPAPPFRYFAAPEPHISGLLHWHLLLFFYGDVDFESLRSTLQPLWPFGRSSFALPRHSAALARYVAKYALKGHNRAMMSRGLGEDYWMHYVGDCLSFHEIDPTHRFPTVLTYDGERIIMPRKYREVLKEGLGIDAEVCLDPAYNHPLKGPQLHG